MDIKKLFFDSEKGDIDIKIFINETGKYVMCPYARSPIKQWIGMAKLDYFIIGDYKNDTEDCFVKNILESIKVGANYDKLNIDRCSNVDDLVTRCLLEAKKNKYDKFHVISIELSDMREFIEVVEWERVNKSSKEWRGNPNSVQYLNYDDLAENIFSVISKLLNE